MEFGFVKQHYSSVKAGGCTLVKSSHEPSEQPFSQWGTQQIRQKPVQFTCTTDRMQIVRASDINCR